MDIRSIHSCIKYFETTLDKVPRIVKEGDQDMYCGPVLTDFAKELIHKVENRKKTEEPLTRKSSRRKNISR